MTKIEEYLATWPDQSLANLQCAAEDGTLKYYDTCACLLHFKSGNYSVTKSMMPGADLAQAAELEFCALAKPYTFVPENDDLKRSQVLLPIIHAEWARRAAEREEAARQEALVEC